MIDWLLMSWLPRSNIFASLYFLLSVFLRSAKIDCFWERTVTAWRVSDEGEARPRLRKDKDAIKELWLPLPPPKLMYILISTFRRRLSNNFHAWFLGQLDEWSQSAEIPHYKKVFWQQLTQWYLHVILICWSDWTLMCFFKVQKKDKKHWKVSVMCHSGWEVSSSGVSDQHSVGSSPGLKTCDL